ncbi:MAG TPA: trifunctional transcriptional regulator/proline dehydrogenase/L-glutamate gamma-semialdehyde dehydrogenase, partial [Gammaproteobacteria bacterium]|nr:trifunctional transcriptional regulator/proline dehydrogenase/L-glutamate gamma-semialdehyde dehydrogenase [Gammaproteobacteria bacterium]
MSSNDDLNLISSKLRKKLCMAYRMDERECLKSIIKQAMLPAEQLQHVRYTAEQLINAVRGTNNDTDHFRALLTEYDLSNAEGVALMCLAEAILRIPDKTTIEKLITDKISHADWAHHLGRNKSKFVNSTTWSLLLTGKILNLSGVLPNLLKRCGEPIVRQAVTQAVKMLCKQFVLGQNIDEALHVAAGMPDYLFSFDMLGEEARTTADAHTY